MKKQYIRGELPKKGELEQFADLGGGRGWGWSSLAKKREGVIPKCTLRNFKRT